MIETETVIIPEQRLSSTLITGKPAKESFLVSAISVFSMALFSIFYWQDPLGWSKYLPASKEAVLQSGQWWRIFTAIFIHADLGHFLSNMYMLSIFCFFIYGYFGFKIFPLFTVLAASLANLFAITTYPPDVKLLGASGLVYLLGGFWLTMYFLIQRQYKLGQRLLRVTGISLMIFAPSTFIPSTSYRTHAIGFAMGILIGIYYFFKNRDFIRGHEVYTVSLVETEPTYH